jgi:lipopolysaccharide heptosyltransferase II
LDREELALRNNKLTDAFHALAAQYYIRRVLLYLVGYTPIMQQKPIENERILLIRPDHVGDMLLTTPAIHALRVARPNAEIHMLVGAWSGNVLANYPDVDAILTLPFPAFTRSIKRDWLAPYRLVLKSARQLRKIGYSSAVILRPDHWWGGMLAHLAGIPERIGYNFADVAPFLTDKIPHRHQHAIIQSMRLVERWTGKIATEDIDFTFHINDADRGYVNGYLQEWDIKPQKPIFCIHPGSGTWVKLWETGRWAAVADTLIEQLDASVVFTGGNHELLMTHEIVSQMKNPACIAVSDTDLGQLAALFARARVVIGPDSGPLHLASAVGTPTVTLFGPADSVEFGPWGPEKKHIVLTGDIDCRPCRVLDWGNDKPEFHPCVREISIGQVLEAARIAAQTKGNEF